MAKPTISLQHSKMTDRVYAVTGRNKTDVTNDFLFCAIRRWAGFVETITDNEGSQFKISVKRIPTENENSSGSTPTPATKGSETK